MCKQILPSFPIWIPKPEYHIVSYPTDTRPQCKMCGQIRP
jgi:hypothetical protein